MRKQVTRLWHKVIHPLVERGKDKVPFKTAKSGEQPQGTTPLPETLPLSTEGLSEALQQELPPLRPPQLMVGVGLSTGMQRDHNEDAVLAQTLTLAAGEHDLLAGVYVVADGMGGHQFGEVASATAVRAFAQHLYQHLLNPLMQPDLEPPDTPIIDLVTEAVAAANQAVLSAAPGGGTTLTAALVLGGHITLAHVGDSRAYYIYPDGRAQVLTRDHSLVKRLEELGQLTPEEAAVHPQRNVLYRALGQVEPLDPDVFQIPLPKSGHLLLCSDGLWGVVPEDDLVRLVTQAETPTQACEQLVYQANTHGGPDNISVILLRFGGG